MPAKIFPSVLGSTRVLFTRRLEAAARLHRPLHLDVMDGHFVATTSIGPRSLASLIVPRRHEVHLMVKRPEVWLDCLLRLGTTTVIIPVELGRRLTSILAAFRSHRLSVALSINPRTPLRRLHPWMSSLRRVHVMTVHPGRYRATFLPAMVKRITQIRRQYPNRVVSCDGGLDQRTIPLVCRAGATLLIVGSAVMLQPNPVTALGRLERLL